MNRLQSIAPVLAMLLCLAPLAADGHPMTEKYIPVGAYPDWDRGLVRGTVESVDRAAGAIVVGTASGTVRARIGEDTRIWLDRSAQSLPVVDGDLGDVSSGQQVEVRRDGDYGKWIKVRVE